MFGTLNGVPGVNVQFSSTQTLLEPTSAPARITVNPDTTALDNLTISVVGRTFGDLIFNPAISTVGNPGGTAHVTVNSVDDLGNPEVPSPFDYSLSNGQNFLTITTTGGEKIVDMTIEYPSGFTDLRGVTISAVTVPEPSTFVPLLSLALGSIILVLKPRNICNVSSR